MLTTALLSAATENPAGDLKPGLEPSQVSPGIAGFIATFFLAALVIVLVIDFNRRNRRLRYRTLYAEKRAAEEGVGGYAHHRASNAEAGAVDDEQTLPAAEPGPDDATRSGSTAQPPRPEGPNRES